MKLSIIVPIYNVETYLAKCVDSLLQQDISKEEYEIILVDDGSTDGSAAIADKYAQDYANVSVIHQKNKGLSSARNTGIDAAKGEYIQFVDSDDYLEANVLGTLVDKVYTENLDVLRFNYQNVNEEYQVFNPYKSPRIFVDYRDEICDGLRFLTNRLGYACYAWQFIISNELTGIRFTPGIYFEDTEWTPRMLLQAKRVTSVDTIAYNYLMRTGSITQSVNFEKKRKVLNDKLLLIDSMKKQSESVVDKRWFEGMIAGTCISICGMLSIDFYAERTHYLKLLQEKEIYPLSTYQSSVAACRKIKLINFSPRLFCWLLHLKNK